MPGACSDRHYTLSNSYEYFEVGSKNRVTEKEERSIKQNKQKALGLLTLQCFWFFKHLLCVINNWVLRIDE